MPTDDRQTLAWSRDAIRVVLARRDELGSVLAVQREGFERIARAFNIAPEHLSPLTETVEDLRGLQDAGMTFFVAVDAHDVVVGTVRACINAESTVEVGRLAVAESHLRCGVATALMTALESCYPQARRFELFTGAEAQGPLKLYRKLGYGVFAAGDTATPHLVWLEKPGASA